MAIRAAASLWATITRSPTGSPRKETAGDWRGYQSVSFDLKIITFNTLLAPGAMIGIVSAHGELIQKVTTAPFPRQWNHDELALNPTAFGVMPEQFEKTCGTS